MVEGKDYILVDINIINLIKKNYEIIIIHRQAIISPMGAKTVPLYYYKVIIN